MIPLPAKPEFSETSAYWLAARDVYVSCRQHGAENPFAIGIMANLDAESAFKTNVIGDDGTAFNEAQWHSDRVARILENTGIDLKAERSIPRVIYGLFWEMTHVPAYENAYNQMMTETSAENAAEIFCRYVEGAGAADAQQRRALNAAFWTVAVSDHQDFFATPPDP